MDHHSLCTDLMSHKFESAPLMFPKKNIFRDRKYHLSICNLLTHSTIFPSPALPSPALPVLEPGVYERRSCGYGREFRMISWLQRRRIANTIRNAAEMSSSTAAGEPRIPKCNDPNDTPETEAEISDLCNVEG